MKAKVGSVSAPLLMHLSSLPPEMPRKGKLVAPGCCLAERQKFGRVGLSFAGPDGWQRPMLLPLLLPLLLLGSPASYAQVYQDRLW